MRSMFTVLNSPSCACMCARYWPRHHLVIDMTYVCNFSVACKHEQSRPRRCFQLRTWSTNNVLCGHGASQLIVAPCVCTIVTHCMTGWSTNPCYTRTRREQAERLSVDFGKGWRWHLGDAPDGPGFGSGTLSGFVNRSTCTFSKSAL